MSYCTFFFFQAEDGIRDIGVTGVQTCALPICARWRTRWARGTGYPVGSRTPTSRCCRCLLPPDARRSRCPRGNLPEKQARSRWQDSGSQARPPARRAVGGRLRVPSLAFGPDAVAADADTHAMEPEARIQPDSRTAWRVARRPPPRRVRRLARHLEGQDGPYHLLLRRSGRGGALLRLD